MAFINTINNNSADGAMIIKRFFKILKRNRLLILLIFSLMNITIYTALMMTSNVYESQAQLLVKLGRENTQVPITVEKGDVYSTGVQKEEINSNIRLIQSNEIINDTIDKIGVDRFESKPEKPRNFIHSIKLKVKQAVKFTKKKVDYFLIRIGLRNSTTDREKIFKALKRGLNVYREKDSNVISISMRLGDPELARDVISTVIESYRAQHISLNNKFNMIDTFGKQAEVYRAELKAKEAEIEKTKRKWDISIPDVQLHGILQNLQTLEMTMNLQFIEKEKLISQKEILRAQFAEHPETRMQAELIGENPSAILIKEELVALKIRQAKQLKLYNEDSHIVKVLSERILNLERLLKKENTQIRSGATFQPNPVSEEIAKNINNVEVELSGIDASILKLKNNIQQLRYQMVRVREGETILTMLNREHSVLEEKFLSNASRAERVKMEEALDKSNISNISILSKPNNASEPIGPKRLLLMILGCIMALFFSIALALVYEWLTQKIHEGDDLSSMEDINYLGDFMLSPK